MSEVLPNEQNKDLIAKALADQIGLERSGKFLDTEEARRKQDTAFADGLLDSGASDELRDSQQVDREGDGAADDTD